MQFLAKKSLKKESISNHNWKGCLAPKKAYRHSWSVNRHMASANRHMTSANRRFPSVDWPKCSVQPGILLIKIKPIFFELLEIKMCSNSYLILFNLFFKHPNLYKYGRPPNIQYLFSDPYFWPFLSNFSSPLKLKTF